ncbi:MAG: class I SAM-dependent methyltransferase [Pseudomonadota bacterium]
MNSCILLDTRQEARQFPVGRIALGFCSTCGFISNTAFDPSLIEYSARYEETQGFSGTFNRFHRELAQHLIDRYDLRGKRVLEIGCGKGEFLLLLSELGDNEGIGFDPGYDEQRMTSEAAKRLTFIKDFYSEQYSDVKADLVCCKMTLEHIHEPAEFMTMVRRAIGDAVDTVVFFQIPEATRILRDCAFEDIYYEHCSYFTPGSLARTFRRAGFQVVGLDTEYDGQYLTIDALPATGSEHETLALENDLETVSQYVGDFPARYQARIAQWRTTLEAMQAAGERVVLWGSGSKAVSFLTTTDRDGLVEYVVDINPYRQGHFMPSTAQEIVGPDFLAEYQPDVVVIMNPIYLNEIQSDLAARGLAPRLLTL